LRTPKTRVPVVVVWMPTSRMQRKGFFSCTRGREGGREGGREERKGECDVG